MGRIDNPIHRRPSGYLHLGHLPPSNLVQGNRHIHPGEPICQESQVAHVFIGMRADKLQRGGIEQSHQSSNRKPATSSGEL